MIFIVCLAQKNSESILASEFSVLGAVLPLRHHSATSKDVFGCNN